ncbi:MAG: hypothetical protein AABZ47_18225 [Planctomycetota bacterium]
MDEEQARCMSWTILGEIEETMSWDGVELLSNDPQEQPPVRAHFRDREYQQLKETIVALLKEAWDSDVKERATPKTPAGIGMREVR